MVTDGIDTECLEIIRNPGEEVASGHISWSCLTEQMRDVGEFRWDEVVTRLVVTRDGFMYHLDRDVHPDQH